MQATERANKIAAEARLRSPSALFRRFRKSVVPAGGWDNDSFNSQGDSLLKDITDVIQMAKMRGTRVLGPDLAMLMDAQFLGAIDEAMAVYSRSYATQPEQENQGPGAEYLLALWLLAIRQSLSISSMQVALITTPVVQSVVQDVYTKVMILLGVDPNKVQLTLMTNEARSIATSLQSISQTTSNRMAETVENAVAGGAGMFAIIAALKARESMIVSNRVNTILRTEFGRAADEAVMSAYRDSKRVSHVSVVGCQAIEPNIPTFAGVPTCNIQNVPIGQARRLVFHPNHTGIIVPSAFYNRDGTVPKILVSRGRA